MLTRRDFIAGGSALILTSSFGLANAAQAMIDLAKYSEAKGEPVLVDPVYATRRNFVGKPLSGYSNRECLTTPAVAESLMNINRQLANRDDLQIRMQLLVKDIYRPQEATDEMVHWAEQQPNPEHYLGKYIAKHSSHRSGKTVDLTLATCSGSEMWMGSYFDEFNANAHFGTTRSCTGRDTQWGYGNYYSVIANPTPLRLREVLRTEMKKEGFTPYALEWWHFSKK